MKGNLVNLHKKGITLHEINISGYLFFAKTQILGYLIQKINSSIFFFFCI